MKAKQPGIGPIGVLLLVCLAVIVSATSCKTGSSQSNEAKSSNEQKSQTPTPEPKIITVSMKAKRIEAVILRDGLVNEDELAGLGSEELRILRNVVFARHGMQFERPGLGDYFYNCDWYKPDSSRTPESTTNWQTLLTASDQKNKETILRKEKGETADGEKNNETISGKGETAERKLPIGGCPKEVSLALCDAIHAQGIEKIARREGLLAKCSDREASEVFRKCVELGKGRQSLSDARNLAERAVVSAGLRCKGKVERRGCMECLLSCAQEGRERTLECETKLRESQIGNVDRCLETVLRQSASCFTRCN